MPPPPLPPVYTFYRSNISPDIVAGQAKVFAHLGIELIQCLDNSAGHSEWLDRVFSEPRDITVVCDIDAFPLTRDAYIRFLERIYTGAVVGLEQVANHLDPEASYAGPMFLGCMGKTWQELGRPSLSHTDRMDVGQNLTVCARSRGVAVGMIPPQFAIRPKWPLADRGIFGIGTFYGTLDFFHLFESRADSSIALFNAVSEGVVSGRHDFARYIAAVCPAQTPGKRRGIWPFRKERKG